MQMRERDAARKHIEMPFTEAGNCVRKHDKCVDVYACCKVPR